MHEFIRNLLTEWRKLNLPFENKTFVVAVSGGADSVALAVALDDLKKRGKLNLRFVVAHFNHDLRGEESEMDAGFVKDLAQKFHFELAYKKRKISKEGNLEQNARIARYAFLTETAENLHAYGILTAHTVNDQAETFLLNLIRGSGIAGLSGMKPIISDFKFQISNEKSGIPKPEKQSQVAKRKTQIALVRPLLSWATRCDTENFCHFKGIDSRYDSMNEDLSFKRVRVRKILLPLLKEFNPKIIETLARTASLLQIEDQKPKTKDQFLILKDLKILEKSAFYLILREWLEAHRGDLRKIDLKHIEAIERLVFSRKSGRIVELPGGETVVKEGGKLFWKKKNIENIE